ncbi:hypothetical protein [Novosphingobium sp. MMS21-SN21R]|uniref:hypothetical protein n=1 Tax=Novosphingobium sp. MMS21-SN21R TaxID=2969298 RepID=UPI0028856CD9|nr:hypothetical protein [Novosphingobium sp. MMS21-SN21R]MDT0507493.1 hypothetical protein [Novosphingobium sp. MMS21-SN21R]
MKHSGAVAGMVAALFLLAGCMLLPGKFASDLALRRDGTFSFAYKGEIYLLALSKMAAEQRSKDSENATFEPSTCYNDETGDERECSKDEIAEQKKVWEDSIAADKASAAEKKKSDDAMAKAMLGGIDPSDPRAAQEFAERLRRQRGWKSVIDKGDGKFEVDFAISGRLDHDFSFPTVEKLPMVTPFVTLIRRADGSVRIEAPAFAPSASQSPMMGMAAASAGKDGKAGAEGMPTLDGVLTLVTDGEILANNTEEGPSPVPTGKKLVWMVNARTASAPTALVRINP